MKKQQVRAGARRSDSRGLSSRRGHQIGQVSILRLFRSHVGRLADALTELGAVKEILREVRKSAGQQEHADRLFFEAKNFYDGLLQGFDWGWRAAKWIRTKEIKDVDLFVIRVLLKNRDLSNAQICRSLDH